MDLIKTFKPFFTVLQFYGLTSHKIIKKGKHHYFSKSNFLYLYSRFTFCVYILFQILMINKLKRRLNDSDNNILSKIVTSFDMTSLMFNALFGIYFGLKKSPEVYDQLNKWNVFQKENIRGQSETSRKGKAVITFLSLFHFVYPVFMWLIAGLSHGEGYKEYTLTIFIFFLDIYLSGSVSHKFLVCISVIGISYIKIKQIVEKHGEDFEFKDLKIKYRAKMEFIRKLMAADDCLKDLGDTLNMTYGPIALCLMMLYFIEAIFALSQAFVFDEGTVTTVIWFSYNVVQFATTCIICSFTKRQVDLFSQHLHVLSLKNENSGVLEELEIFSLQLLHRDINFDACGFFKLNMSLFYSMAGIVTTYLIILIQFKNSQRPQINNCTAAIF